MRSGDAHGIYRCNRKDGAFYILVEPRAGLQTERQYAEVSAGELRKICRRLGVRLKPDPDRGELESDFDLLHIHIILYRRVDLMLPGYAGYDAGVYDCAGVRLLVMKSPRRLHPAEGPWNTVLAFIRGLLPVAPDGVDQAEIFLAWLAVTVKALERRQARAGQILILCGQKNDGKSRLQHFIITPLLGGRSADPADWLLGITDFNSECFGSEHLLLEDTPSSQKKDERNQWKQRLKGVAVNDTARLHSKGQTAVTLRPFWRLSISLNNTPDDMALLPPPSSDWVEKSIMLETARPAYLPCTDEERQEWREALEREMPCFLHYLLHGHEIPEDCKGARFGVRSYENPGIRSQLEDAAPWAEVWDTIEDLQPWKNGAGGTVFKAKLHEIEALLTDAPDVGDSMGRLLKKNSLAHMLRHIMAEYPDRVGKTRTGTRGGGRYWLIFSPKADKNSPITPPHSNPLEDED